MVIMVGGTAPLQSRLGSGLGFGSELGFVSGVAFGFRRVNVWAFVKRQKGTGPNFRKNGEIHSSPLLAVRNTAQYLRGKDATGKRVQARIFARAAKFTPVSFWTPLTPVRDSERNAAAGTV